MFRAPRPGSVRAFRFRGIDRTCQRVAVSGALPIAVSVASWGWALAATPTPTSPSASVRYVGTHAGAPASSVYGITDTPAAGLRVALNNLFAEHVYLAARATGAALGNRQPEFEAAAAALDANSVDISKAIGLAYGADAEAAFLPLWRSHIGMVVDYTVGKATNDQAKQDKAVNDLVGYTQDFGAFLSGANENLPKDVVADLVKHHVLTLKDVIDAQAASNATQQFMAIRAAGHHMGMIADPLAEATAVKFPDKFQGMMEAPGQQPSMGHEHGTSGGLAPLFDPRVGADCACCASPCAMPTENLKLSVAEQMAGDQAAEIKLFHFNPDVIEVPVGATVTWTNGDAIQHSVTATDASFDSGFFTQGESYSHTFDQPGTFEYVCERHASMHGEVHVVE
jgi:plastocyanin